MKRGLFLAVVMATTVFVGAGLSARAGQKGDAAVVKKSVVLIQSAQLGGRSLEQGKYVAEITGGDEATLVLKRDKEVVARVRVKRTELATPAKYDRVDLRVTGAGKEIASLFFKGDRGAFEVLDDQGVAIAEKP